MSIVSRSLPLVRRNDVSGRLYVMSNPFTSLSLVVLTLLSIAACVVAASGLRRPDPNRGAGPLQRWLVTVVGLSAAGLYLYRWLAVPGQWQPLAAHVDGLLLIGALFAGAVLYIQMRPELFGLSAFALPLLALILAWGICASAWTYHPFNLDTLHPVWTGVHLSGVYLGTLCCGVAAIAGGMFLYVRSRIKRKIDLSRAGRLASLERLEGLIIGAAALGFGLLTLGLAAGLVIIIDPPTVIGAGHWSKIVLAAAAWLAYALVMNVRYASFFRGARAAWLAIGGLVLLLAVYGLVSALPDRRGSHEVRPNVVYPPRHEAEVS